MDDTLFYIILFGCMGCLIQLCNYVQEIRDILKTTPANKTRDGE